MSPYRSDGVDVTLIRWMSSLTSAERLEVGAIGRGRVYADLLPHATAIAVGGGLRVPVLDLETLIAVKEETGGEKDLATLPILRRTLEETRRA